MPVAGEIVSNRPLAGSDLAKIILADVAQVLEGNGMMSGHIAYGRVAYEVRVTLHLDNPSVPTDVSVVRSVKRADNAILEQPELAAIEAMPLAGADSESFVSSVERSRSIDSPNAARLAHGLPLAITRRDSTGQYVEESVKYPTSAAPDDYPEAEDVDLTRMARAELNLPVKEVGIVAELERRMEEAERALMNHQPDPNKETESWDASKFPTYGKVKHDPVELAPAEEHKPVPPPSPRSGKPGKHRKGAHADGKAAD